MALLDDEELLKSTISPTPRNQILGLLSDFIAQGYDPRRTQQMQGISKFLMAPEISQTLDRLSYDPSGRSLFTGAGGLGGTTRMRPEALDAALAVAPMAGPAARLAGRGAMSVGRAGERMAERVVPQIMQRGGLPAELLQGMSRGTVSPLDVYHGTPHTLPPTARNPLGEFDASKIGTGEGAQAYGLGIYTAENPAVAGGYAKNVKDMTSIRKMNEELSRLSKVMESDSSGGYRKFKSNVGEDAAKRYDELMTDRNKVSTSVGNLYKVDLPDEMIPKMLDYDKPLSKQDPYVRDIIAKAFPSGYINGKFVDPLNSRATGRAMLDQLDMIANKRNEPGFMSAETALRQAGIPGIKYLDEGSRAKGEGTRNFVTFPGEEKNLRILERNGLLGD